MSSLRISDRARRAGCIATAFVTLALYFLVGAIISALTGDMVPTLQSVGVAVVLIVIAVVIAKRRKPD
ncbi:MAG: hypothetical protein H7X80_09255 [bacterium]|nr:hypothetical protein [Candidatus Kapabacteria bacterium]